MKNDLEKSVGMHRRVRGKGRSNPGDDVGVFDFRWRANVHSCARRVACTVRRGQGWECLSILVYDRDSKNGWHQRSPTWREVWRVLPLFFKPEERPIQYWRLGDLGREGMHLFLSERSNQMIPFLPAFGENFTLIPNENQQVPHSQSP